MIKTRGLSSCNKKDINMFGEKNFKKNIPLKIDGTLREIESITTAAEIIKVELQKPLKAMKEDYSLIVFFRIQLKVTYALKNSLDLRVYTLVFIEDIKIDLPREIYYQLMEYTFIDGRENCELYVERVKAAIEDKGNISLAFYVMATAFFSNLSTLEFKAAFSTGEENIFTLNFSDGTLKQRTFFFDNRIEALHIKKQEGFLAVKENQDTLYFLGREGLDRIITLENPGKILSVLKIHGDNLIVTAEREGKVNIYLYSEGFFDSIARDIYRPVKPVYVADLGSLIYAKASQEEISLIKIQVQGMEQEEVILKNLGPCSCLAISKNEKQGGLVINSQEILIFSLKGDFTAFIKEDRGENLQGTIVDLRFTRNEDTLLVKTKEEGRAYLYQVFASRGIFRRLITREEALDLQDFQGTFDDSHIYISATSMGGANIYKMNLKTLEKELLLELNSNKIEFLKE